MKKVIVASRGYFRSLEDVDYSTGNKLIIFDGSDLSVSDGYHSMDELYDHRIQLFITLCHSICGFRKDPYIHEADPMPVWRSMLHHDGKGYEGEFILGISKEKGKQITYHIPHARWDEVSFAETLEKAPEWDGHTSYDVLDRLKNL